MQTAINLPEKPFRHTIIILLRKQLEKAEETEYLIDCIEDMWKTIDIIGEQFGKEEADKIIHASLGIGSFAGEAS